MWDKWFVVIFISIIPLILVAVQFSLVFYFLGLNVSTITITSIFIAEAFGLISYLPLGVGVKDFAIFYQSCRSLGVKEIILGLLWVRIIDIFVLGVIQALLKYRKAFK